MTDEPKHPPHPELIDQYETFMRDQKAARQESKPASLESLGVEEKPKSEPATAAKPAPKVFGPPPKAPFEPARFNPDDLTQVPGVVGMLIDWIVKSALYPNKTLALGAALVAVGTLMGRRVMTPTRGVTHLYVVGVAESATGKQHPADCLKEALTVAGMSHVLCGEIKSSAALAKILTRQGPIVCAVIDEYGLVLDRLVRPNATSSETSLMSDMRALWGTQFGKQYHTATTLDRPVELIYGPAFSIFALSIPEDVGAAFKSKHILGGFFNRHLYLIGDKRAPKQDPGPGNVPLLLAARLKALGPHSDGDAIINQKSSEIKSLKESKDEKLMPVPITAQVELRWGPGAKAVWDQLDSLASEPDRIKQTMFARVSEMTVRLASIVAFGRGSRTVDEPDMLWGRAIAMRSAQDMYEAVLKHMDDPKSHNAMCQEILDILAESPDGFVSQRDIARKTRKYKVKGDDLNKALDQLKAEERIELEIRKTAGRSSYGYRLLQD